MTVLLVNANRVRPAIAPLGLEYVAGSLHRAGVAFELWDLNFRAESDLLRRAGAGGPDVVAVGITLRNVDSAYLVRNAFFVPQVKQLVQRIKNVSGAAVVLGGAGFSIMPAEIMEFCGADFGIAGWGEAALTGLWGRLTTGAPRFADIPGLLWRERDQLCRNALAAPGHDAWPPRRRGFVNNREYYRRSGMGNIETQRGCPMRCAYCVEPGIVGCEVAQHPVAGVVAELRQLQSEGIGHVHFCDSEFNVGEGHAERLCDALIKANLGVTWSAFLYPLAALLPAATCRKMREAGCAEATLCVDSGSEAVLKQIGKAHSVGDVVEVTRRLREAGIRITHSYVAGSPGDTVDTMRESCDLMRRTRPDICTVFAGIRIYPGTAIHREAVREGIVEVGQNLLTPVFYHADQVLRETLPALRKHAKGIPNVLIPTRSVDFLNLVAQNIYMDGFAGSFADFIDHVNALSRSAKLRLGLKSLLQRLRDG